MIVRDSLIGVVALSLCMIACAGEGFSGGAGGNNTVDAGGSGGSGAQAGSGGSSAQAGSGGSGAQAGSGGSGAQAGSGGSGAQAGSGGTQTGGQGGGSTCEDEVAPATAIHVSNDLGNDNWSGTSTQPLKSLRVAIAKGEGNVIVLEAGEYTEGPLQLGVGESITIRGGYTATTAGEWRRTCNDYPTRTKIVLAQGTGFDSSGDLSLGSVAFTQAAPETSTGHASIGLFIRSGSLKADNVAITAAPGSAGAAPAAAAPGADGTAQLSVCKNGEDGPIGAAGTRQTAWSISKTGFSAGSAEAGLKGVKGDPGKKGQGATSRSDCVLCSCTNSCNPTAIFVTVGPATCGDGGEPGDPGNGGLGGGASIALFLAPSVAVSLANVTLTADRGGEGSTGGLGGLGGHGADGAPGQNSGACCRAGCAKEGDGSCSGGCYPTPYQGGGQVGPCPAGRAVTNSAGGKGGRGSQGGPGADGPHGPAFALVQAKSDTIDLTNSVTLQCPSSDPNAAQLFMY